MKKSLIHSIYILLLLLFTLSHTLLAGGEGKLYKTFYVGEAGIQYFIKPIVFQMEGAKGVIALDFTFRHKDGVNNPVRINYSFIGENIIKNVDSLVFSNGKISVSMPENALSYNEKEKSHFVSRFTSENILFSELKELFNASDWTIKAYIKGDKPQIFKSSKNIRKKLSMLNESIFLLY